MVLVINNMLIEEQFDIANGEAYSFNLRIFPVFSAGSAKILLFQCKLLFKHNLKSLLYYHDIIEIEQKTIVVKNIS